MSIEKEVILKLRTGEYTMQMPRSDFEKLCDGHDNSASSSHFLRYSCEILRPFFEHELCRINEIFENFTFIKPVCCVFCFNKQNSHDEIIHFSVSDGENFRTTYDPVKLEISKNLQFYKELKLGGYIK